MSRAGLVQNVRIIDGESDLGSDAGRRDVLAAQKSKRQAQAVADLVPPAHHGLELAASQTRVVINAAVNFSSQRQAQIEVMQQREPAGENVSTLGLYSQNSGAGRPPIRTAPLLTKSLQRKQPCDYASRFEAVAEEYAIPLPTLPWE